MSRDGISPDLQKVEAVRDFPQLQDVRSLCSFLGLTSYYRKFIPGFSAVANPVIPNEKGGGVHMVVGLLKRPLIS